MGSILRTRKLFIALFGAALVNGVLLVYWLLRPGPNNVTEIAYDLYTSKFDGTDLVRIDSDPRHSYWGPAWSPIGKRLAFSNIVQGTAGSDIYLANADGSSLAQLTHTESQSNYLPAWSPDGARIAYIGGQQADYESTSELFIMDTTGSNQRQLTHNNAQEYGVSFSPDGQQLVCGSKQDETWQLHTISADGTKETKLNSGGGNAPDWSPDGSKIVFTSDREGNDSIYIVDAAGSPVQRLTNNTSHNDNARWSHDGQRIIYASDVGGNNSIFIMKTDGSAPQQVTNSSDKASLTPQWSPDDNKIVYTLTR